MPVPKPRSGETQQNFVSRCISTLEHEGGRPHDQIQFICYSSWREVHKQELEIVSRLNAVKDKLIQIFGTAGEKYFNATMAALGVTITRKGDYFYKGDVSELPFVKMDEDGSVDFFNMILGEFKFTKIDKQNRTVSGYANTLISDCDKDIILPEAYAESVKEYMAFPVTYYSHQTRQPPFGTIDKQHIDELGWWVKTKVAKNPSIYWEMVNDGRLNGYSIGGRFKATPERHGTARVWRVDVHIYDLSAVARPCNKLCFWGMVNESQLSDMITAGGKTGSVSTLRKTSFQKPTPQGAKKKRFKKGDKKMSEENLEDQKSKENEENEENEENVENEETTEKPLSEMTSEELLEHIRKQEREKERIRLLKVAKLTEEEQQKTLGDQRIFELNKQVGDLTVKIDKLTQAQAKVDDVEQRLLKIEEAPDRKGVDTGGDRSEIDKEVDKFEKMIGAGGLETAMDIINKGFRDAAKAEKATRVKA